MTKAGSAMARFNRLHGGFARLHAVDEIAVVILADVKASIIAAELGILMVAGFDSMPLLPTRSQPSVPSNLAPKLAGSVLHSRTTPLA